jgi:hypothetical protein
VDASTTQHTLTGFYTPTDVNGSNAMASEVNGFSYTAANGLDFTNTGGDGATSVTSRIDGQTSADFSGSNKYGSIAAKVFLQGALNGSLMSTNLVLPSVSPYSSDPVDLTGEMPNTADITDWILIEVRDASNINTILSSHSAFLRNNGDIVGLSGAGSLLLKNAPASNAYIVVKHRNHLPIRTNSTVDLYDLSTSSSLTDLTNLSNIFDNGGSNEPVATVGTNIAMFRANVNNDLFLNQIDYGLTRFNAVPFQSNIYSQFDVNMDGTLNQIDYGLARFTAVPFKTAHIQ